MPVGPNQGPAGVRVIGPGGMSGPGFFNLLSVTWDATGCNALTGICPSVLQPPVYVGNPSLYSFENPPGKLHVFPTDDSKLVSGGNSAVGVEIFGFGLSVAPVSGFPNQGACIDPVFGQALFTLPNNNINNDGSGSIYFELSWSILEDTSLAGGIGICPVSSIGSWNDIAANATGSMIVRPDGTVYQDGLVDPSLNPFGALQQGDTIGVRVDFLPIPNLGLIGCQFFGVGGSIIGQFSRHVFFDMPGPCVPCAVFDTTPVSLTGPKYTVTALFSQKDQSAFLGPKNAPSDMPSVILGWPAIEIPVGSQFQ